MADIISVLSIQEADKAYASKAWVYANVAPAYIDETALCEDLFATDELLDAYEETEEDIKVVDDLIKFIERKQDGNIAYFRYEVI